MTTTETETLYNVFHRDWWKPATTPGWPNGREPHAGKKRYLAHGVSYAEARRLCKEYNETHDPGPMSHKAEFESA